MNGAVLVAIAAAIGNLLQGWDNATLAGKENLCLFGYPNETWVVDLPEEDVPPELPEPALGINFARDGMQEKDWLSLVAASDSWLISVAFYFGARLGFGKNESAKYCDVDENGVQYMVLCRVVMGNMELIESGSKQFLPSKEYFDSGVDDLRNPQYYTVWSKNISNHILPEYVVSYKVSPENGGSVLNGGYIDRKDKLENAVVGSFASPMNEGSDHHSHLTSEGCKERSSDLDLIPAKIPKSPWMPFPMLFPAIEDKVPPEVMV